MLQPETTSLERASLTQSTTVISSIIEPTEQLLDQSIPSNTSAHLNLPQQRLCTACRLPFVYNQYSVSNAHRRRVTCLGCNKLFSFISKRDVCQRLQNIENGCADIIGDEARHLSVYYLHEWIEPNMYHFPLSPKRYIKQTNKDNNEEYTYHSTRENTIEHYSRCICCINFVKRKRKTLKMATQKASSYGVATFESLMQFMVNSNATCALTGIKGSWSSNAGDPMYLISLDHKTSLSAGGSSEIDNLQVTLQCFNNIKGNYEAEDFKRWFTAIQQMPKHELQL